MKKIWMLTESSFEFMWFCFLWFCSYGPTMIVRFHPDQYQTLHYLLSTSEDWRNWFVLERGKYHLLISQRKV